jgi:hypothetical protein
LLGVLFGSGAVLALAGAFYARVTKIILPGGAGIELAAVAKDLAKIEQDMPAKVRREIESLPQATRQQLGAEEIATIGSQAAVRAQRELLQTRAAARGAPVAPAVQLNMADVTRAQRGMPLSDKLIGQLVDKAVEDAVRESSRPTSGPPES